LLARDRLEGHAESVSFNLCEVAAALISRLNELVVVGAEGEAQVGLLHVDAPGCLAEGKRAEFLPVSLAEHVGEEGVDGMILGELLLEDEHIVDVGENSMEVARQHVWLNFFAHLCIARTVELLDLTLGDVSEFALALRLVRVDVLHVLHLE